MIEIKRVYDQPSHDDGRRILVDRLWPRGMKKEDAALDAWMKEIAPSDELRRWVHADPGRWSDFVKRYREELTGKEELLEALREQAAEGKVTLLYAAKDRERNNAVALRRILEEGSTG